MQTMPRRSGRKVRHSSETQNQNQNQIKTKNQNQESKPKTQNSKLKTQNQKPFRILLDSFHKSTHKGAITILAFPVPPGSSLNWKTLCPESGKPPQCRQYPDFAGLNWETLSPHATDLPFPHCACLHSRNFRFVIQGLRPAKVHEKPHREITPRQRVSLVFRPCP
jgi:hypothetical protein